jgi:hypothetical protein
MQFSPLESCFHGHTCVSIQKYMKVWFDFKYSFFISEAILKIHTKTSMCSFEAAIASILKHAPSKVKIQPYNYMK